MRTIPTGSSSGLQIGDILGIYIYIYIYIYGMYWGFVGVINGGYIGIMEKKMETTIMRYIGLGVRV